MNMLYFCNTDFDYRIGHILSSAVSERVKPWYLLPLAASDEYDEVIVPSDSIQDYEIKGFSEYLNKCGINHGRVVNEENAGQADDLFCFGYDSYSRMITERYLDDNIIQRRFIEENIVRKVNSKIFTAELLQKTGEDIRIIRAGNFIDSLDNTFPVVVRRMYGCAGNSNFVLKNITDAESFNETIGSNVNELLTIERWYDRIEDFSAGFYAEAGMNIEISFRRLYNSARGGFAAVMTADKSELPSEIIVNAERISEFLNCELTEKGYRGPVNFDFFTYQNGSEIKIKPFCDINARNSMYTIAVLTAEKTGSEFFGLRSCSFRQLKRKGMSDYCQIKMKTVKLYDRLGVDAFLITPLINAGKMIFFFHSHDEFDIIKAGDCFLA